MLFPRKNSYLTCSNRFAVALTVSEICGIQESVNCIRMTKTGRVLVCRSPFIHAKFRTFLHDLGIDESTMPFVFEVSRF